MKEFKSIEETHLPNLGRVFSVILGEDIAHEILLTKGVRGVLGPKVKIDGQIYKVKAVEYSARYSLYKTDIVGILVYDPPQT